MKIDHRRHYILVLDTETANTLTDKSGKLDMSNVLAYDCGWCIMDTRGNVYREHSYVNRDIFYGQSDLMQSAYYSNKIPRYLKDIADGSRLVHNTYGIRRAMLDEMKEFGITEVCAHNARFDINALNTTLRYVTKSRSRYWFPYGTEVWDSMLMARSVIHKMPTYQKWAIENNALSAKTKQLSTTAENLYRFISKDNDFTESHTGLEDVQIEREIIKYCYRQKKQMKKVLYGRKY